MAYETHKNSTTFMYVLANVLAHTNTRTHTYGYIHINNHWTLNKKAPEEEVDMRKDEHEDVDVEVEVPENFPIKCRQFYKPPNSKTTTTTTNCGATNASHWVCNKNQALFFFCLPLFKRLCSSCRSLGEIHYQMTADFTTRHGKAQIRLQGNV